MSKYKDIGVVNPGIKMEAVFYQMGRITRSPVIAFRVLECSDKSGGNSLIMSPLCWNREVGDIIPTFEIGSYLGLEAEGKEKDWTQRIKEIDEFEEKERKEG